MNSRLSKLESAMAARASVSDPLLTNRLPISLPSCKDGMIQLSLTTTSLSILMLPFAIDKWIHPNPSIPPSNVAPSSPIDMEQQLSSLSDTVASLAESINKGIEQNNLILARQNGQANH
ncbi:hypothetical protein RhiirA1_475816 [Rhizophagus irregularis]|uniref:Uncharacterized protein n=1 Tax=Rhizophagus irregularis TaxID=588596 RepID=A0A2I1EZ46_9GLOM|nr:hypothetical protein RhiirA1_475816 [Rhizophagus irregularis]PKY27392.1 hypothetical protein RhiirB3_443082 [Rhizophagus irregularis]GBC21153.1 hypothetical protein RIR_jg24231.t1 [Rhizophagus irregularis DAOM 181602=DAOM 197198]